MNIRDYIESGIIESYLFGLATAEQEEELTYMRQMYPVLEQEIAATELRIEGKLLEEAVLPPVELKDSIFDKIHQHGFGYYRTTGNNGKGYTPPEQVIINMSGWNRQISVSVWWRCAFIALCVLTMCLVASTWYLYQRTANLEGILLNRGVQPVTNTTSAGR
ncbi:MAG TPA: hypothetical protein VM802_26730 [Chitinophaga sp.]|uniref:hypothetical protein n=1 Tax=Chitinophaga sp. TaxID=1869181 RepID=UPI002BD6F1A8|nr:hypothetical protein [Chitinophaga sp.]HVI48492.1 hypothetical protein [Chitinophaga sp.]